MVTIKKKINKVKRERERQIERERELWASPHN